VSAWKRPAKEAHVKNLEGVMADSVYVLGDEDRRKFAKLIAQAWTDDVVKDRYASDPRGVLAEYEIDYPAGVDTPALPDMPTGDFSVEALEMAAGNVGTASSVSTIGGCFACVATFVP
jgi:putative thiazole/oxazole-modified microcin (TOMM)-like peptide